MTSAEEGEDGGGEFQEVQEVKPSIILTGLTK